MKKIKIGKIITTFAVVMAILCTNVFGANVFADRAPTVTENGMEAYWALDGDLKEGTGASQRDLTVVGSEGYTEGRYGKAFQLDGSTVLRMDGESGISSPNVTVAFWLKLEDLPKDDVGMNEFLSTEGLGALGKGAMDFGFVNGGLRSYIVNDFMAGSGDEIMHGEDIWQTFTDDWHHFALVWDTDTEVSKIYVDGKLVNEAAVESILGLPIQLGAPAGADYEKSDLNIGGYIDTEGNATRTIKGAIDEVAIFSTALTDEEISKMATFTADDTVDEAEDNNSKVAENNEGNNSSKDGKKDNGNTTIYIIVGLAVVLAAVAIFIIRSKKK